MSPIISSATRKKKRNQQHCLPVLIKNIVGGTLCWSYASPANDKLCATAAKTHVKIEGGVCLLVYLDTMYIGTLCTYLYVHHLVINNTSLPWTTSTQLINSKQPKVSPTKQLINFILPLADTVLGDSKYLRYRYVYLIVKYLFSSPSCNTKQEKKKDVHVRRILFSSHQRLHVLHVIVSCKVALHGKTEDFFLVYGPCSKYKVLPPSYM